MYAVSGGASGIGAAITATLRERGDEVIVVDIRNADIEADLSTADGCTQAVVELEVRAPDGLDGLVACAGLGILFFEILFADWVDPQSAKEYIAGMILLGVAPCTAMVFVWSQLVKGDANYTLVQVSINDLIMVFAFAPITAFLLGMTNIIVPWETLFLSVVLYVVIPLLAGYITRKRLDNGQDHHEIARFTQKVKPYSIIGLLAMVVLLFGFQAETILAKPLVIALIAIPLLIQSYGIFAIAYGWAYLWKVPFNVAAPAALIGTSNFFELAVAVAISLFGLNSGAALATVVGVLVEVPVMLSLVALANRTKHIFK
ncbi:bile acid:sodium symporter [Methylophaga sp.]|uniref:bile acid:sodium symporter n=1 Tax=Methylophaga sp. TaxID=2024840 RepID=UPI0023543D97|nr:bile acid:sodium symporter [Methylophaga sp.]